MNQSILHHAFSSFSFVTIILVELHGWRFGLVVEVDCMAHMITSQNESASHTTAGTNASPRNSFIEKLSLLSHQNSAPPVTKCIVKRGENIA